MNEQLTPGAVRRFIGRQGRWISVAESTPDPSTQVAVLNGVTCWCTIWKEGLVSPIAPWPVTHYTMDVVAFRQFPRPYPVQAVDNVRQRSRRLRLEVIGELQA